MFRAFAIAVRTSYLFACLIALLGGSWLLLMEVRSVVQRPAFWPVPDLKELIAVLLGVFFVALPLRALARLLRQRELVPVEHLRDRPIVAALVAITALFGSFLVFGVSRGLVQTLPESADVNLAGPSMLAILLYAFALLTGEVVLVGRIAGSR